ncbi:MAG: N-acetylglucosamine-6-phosphate deacetylase, partial [Pseudomonadota bacterium]
MAQLALIGAQVFDGQTLRKGLAVLIRDGVPKTVAPSALPSGCATVPLNGGILLPGFVDLQVNGGGGIMFGD